MARWDKKELALGCRIRKVYFRPPVICFSVARVWLNVMHTLVNSVQSLNGVIQFMTFLAVTWTT